MSNKHNQKSIIRKQKKFSFVNSLINSVENDSTLTTEERIYAKSQISSDSHKIPYKTNTSEYNFKNSSFKFTDPKAKPRISKPVYRTKRGQSSSELGHELPSYINPKSISARENKKTFFKSQHHHSNSISIPDDLIKQKLKKNMKKFRKKGHRQLTDFSSNGCSSINIRDCGGEKVFNGNPRSDKPTYQEKYLVYNRARSRRKKSSEKNKVFELIYKKRGYRNLKKKNYNYEVLSMGNQSISRVSDKFNTSKYSIQGHRQRLVIPAC